VRRAAWIACLASVATIASVRPLGAQTPPGRLEIGAGPSWIGQNGLGTSNATETTPTGAGSAIFNTTTTLESAAGLGVHIGVRVWRQLEVEAFSTYAKPTLSTAITNDIENSTAVTATERIRQYTVGGDALWYLRPSRRWPRLRPYIGGGVAYLRQLHEANTLAVTGRMVDIGGGVKFLFGARPAKSAIRTFGVRGDARLVAATKGVGFTDKARYTPSVGASLFVRF
jgi:hypothetical protein